MTWNLFIDDERFPPDDGREWVIARNDFEVYYEIAKRNQFPVYISFDHDLGDGEATGYDIAKELVSRDMEPNSWVTIPEDFAFYVHSQNPIGKANIEHYLNNYLNFKSTQGAK
jgi:hypothetical protein